MPRLILVLLAACVDAPSVGRVFECEATFYCDDAPFVITPAHGCADDESEALALFEVRLDDLTRDARCAVKRFEATCRETGERCTQ